MIIATFIIISIASDIFHRDGLDMRYANYFLASFIEFLFYDLLLFLLWKFEM